MIGRMFWLVTALFAGIAAHLATILYAPSLTFERKLDVIAAGHKPNSFFLMTPNTQAGFLPSSTAEDIVGLCMIDLSKGKVVIDAHVPQSFWNFSIYGSSGQQIYDINDVEAGADSFSVELTKAKSLIEQVRSNADPDDAGKIANSGWHAEVPGEQALAVLWFPVRDQTQRKTLEDEVKQTNCNAN